VTDGPPTLYPTIAYEDAPAAIRFPDDCLQLRLQEVYEGADGGVNHALLR